MYPKNAFPEKPISAAFSWVTRAIYTPPTNPSPPPVSSRLSLDAVAAAFGRIEIESGSGGRRPQTIAAAFGHDDFESGSDSKSYSVRGRGFVPNLTRAAPPWWRLARYDWCEVFDKTWVFKRQKRSHLMCGRFYKTQNKANRVASRLDSRQIGNKVSSRTNQDFESLLDSKSP